MPRKPKVPTKAEAIARALSRDGDWARAPELSNVWNLLQELKACGDDLVKVADLLRGLSQPSNVNIPSTAPQGPVPFAPPVETMAQARAQSVEEFMGIEVR